MILPAAYCGEENGLVKLEDCQALKTKGIQNKKCAVSIIYTFTQR